MTSELFFRPKAPMCGLHEHKFACLCANPTVFAPSAGEDQRINLSLFDHTQLQFAIKRGSRYRLPIEHNVLFYDERPARALRFVKKMVDTGASKFHSGQHQTQAHNNRRCVPCTQRMQTETVVHHSNAGRRLGVLGYEPPICDGRSDVGFS